MNLPEIKADNRPVVTSRNKFINIFDLLYFTFIILKSELSRLNVL